MLRLDPAHPPLWRSEDCVQFGVDARARVEAPAAWQERWLTALESGAAPADLVALSRADGIDDARAQRFLDQLDPVLLRSTQRAPRVVVELPADVPGAAADALVRALQDAGLAVGIDVPGTSAAGIPTVGADGDRPVTVVVAHHVVDPRRAAALMAADAVHLPILLHPDGIEIGPRVEPGRTACLACLAARRRDLDPAWPLMVAQLLGRPAPPVAASRAAEAGLVAAALVGADASTAREPRTRSVLLSDDALRRRTRWHRPHAACGCRSLAGTGTADVPEGRAPS